MVFALNCTVTLTFDLVTSEFIWVIYWPWPIFLPSTMTVTHKLFKILSGHDVAYGRTDGRTDERHTIIRPKFYFGRIKNKPNCAKILNNAWLCVTNLFWLVQLLNFSSLRPSALVLKLLSIWTRNHALTDNKTRTIKDGFPNSHTLFSIVSWSARVLTMLAHWAAPSASTRARTCRPCSCRTSGLVCRRRETAAGLAR